MYEQLHASRKPPIWLEENHQHNCHQWSTIAIVDQHHNDIVSLNVKAIYTLPDVRALMPNCPLIFAFLCKPDSLHFPLLFCRYLPTLRDCALDWAYFANGLSLCALIVTLCQRWLCIYVLANFYFYCSPWVNFHCQLWSGWINEYWRQERLSHYFGLDQLHLTVIHGFQHFVEWLTELFASLAWKSFDHFRLCHVNLQILWIVHRKWPPTLREGHICWLAWRKWRPVKLINIAIFLLVDNSIWLPYKPTVVIRTREQSPKK